MNTSNPENIDQTEEETIPKSAREALTVQALALIVLRAGGQIRLPMDELKALFQAPVPTGYVLFDLDQANREIVITARSDLSEREN